MVPEKPLLDVLQQFEKLGTIERSLDRDQALSRRRLFDDGRPQSLSNGLV